MELILLENVDHLGYKNEVVRVKDGYGNNFLLPKGKAILATDSAKKHLQEILKQKEQKESKLRAERQILADQIREMKLKLVVKTGEKNKLFGAVTSADLADLIARNGVTLEKRDIAIRGGNVKVTGTYQADIRLHREVSVLVSFEVAAEPKEVKK
jgi:large subunit ribosomal protein L9